jgi:hypothetical protein
MSQVYYYPYNPRWQVILGSGLLFAACCPIMVYIALHPDEGLSIVTVLLGSEGASLFFWLLALFSAMFVLKAVALAKQRLDNPQFLELREDALVLPQQPFFQIRIIRIAYADIERVWEVQVSGQTFLYLTSGGRKQTIVASLLPDMDSYIAVKDFLQSHVQHQNRQQPCA